MAPMLTRAAGWLLVRLLVTAAILGYLASRIDITEAARAVVGVRVGHLLLVLALVAADRAVMILRWILLLRASGVAIETPRAASIFLVSSFVGSFLPAGVGGDVARAYGLSREATTASEAVASVVVDRLLGVLSLIVMGAVGFVVAAPTGLPRGLAVTALVAVIVLAAALFWMDGVVRMLPRWRGTAGLLSRMDALGDAVARYRRRGRVMARVLAWSMAVQLLRILQAFLLGLGLGIGVPFSTYLLFMPIGLLMLMLPVSISGFGLPQGVFVWMLVPLGVSDELALALSTLIVLTGLAGNLPGLILWLGRRHDVAGTVPRDIR
jgi:uncharacterized membrane protein YbhN (UPF0104 family)